MTVKDVNGTVIDPVSLPGAVTVYSTTAAAQSSGGEWYHVNWITCGIEIVADKNTSDKDGLKLYAHVFDYVNEDHSGSSPSNNNVYTKYNGTDYDNRTWANPYNSRTPVSWNGSKPGILTDTNGHKWESYFPIGTSKYSSGSVTTGGAKTGYYPNVHPSGNFSGGFPTSGWAGSVVTASYNIQTTTVQYKRGSADQGNVVTEMRIIGWENSNWFFEIIGKPSDYQKANYHFTKWNTKENGSGTDYLPGDLYYGTEPLELYAQWESDNVTLSYNKNIPSGVTEINTITVPSSVGPTTPPLTTTVGAALVGEGNLNPPRHFEKWNTKADGSGTDYAPSAYITCDTNQVLYAKWSNDYRVPEWDGAVNVYRCDVNGQSNQSEEYLRITGHVKIYKTQFLTINNVSPANAPYELTCGPITLSAGDFSVSDEGSYISVGFDYHTSNQVVSIGQTYSFTVSFTDLYGHQYGYAPSTLTTQKSIGVAFVTFSTNGRGKSAAFGIQAAAHNDNSRPIPANGRLDIAMDTYFTGLVKGIPVDGQTIQYNASDELEVISGGYPYEEITGGNSLDSFSTNTFSDWPTTPDYSYPVYPNQHTYGYGWKQRKWKESSSSTGGRLEQWVWCFAKGSDFGTDNWWTLAMPKYHDNTLEQFNAVPNWTTTVMPREGRIGYVTVVSITLSTNIFGITGHLGYINSSYPVSSGYFLFQFYFDGYWGT